MRPDEDFAMSWEVDGPSSKRLGDIAKAVKDADGLILATDPDREGEAISWHVLEVLQQKRALKGKPVSRVVFNAITKQSVLEAMANPRQIDAPLVDAYLARRALDYLVGFTPVAGAVAQAAGRPFGRPRAVGGAARWSATAKPRSSASSARNTGRSPRRWRRRAATCSRRG